MDALEYMSATCPYCGETMELTIERSREEQSYSEDCPVCCRPVCIEVRMEGLSDLSISARREDE